MTEQKIEFNVDRLTVKIFKSRLEMGNHAAVDVAEKIKELLDRQETVNMIFAAAPSQNEFLKALSEDEEINWTRINAFHMDEYIGLPMGHPERFSNFLRKQLFESVPFKKVFYLNENGWSPEEEIQRYTKLLQQHPADIVCMGIGENAHIAFNDPHVADFNDQNLVKQVQLEEASRLQQVHDGCFERLEEVPEAAITLTVPALLQARYLFCMVPGDNKAEAVYHTLTDEIKENYPSTILRKHPNSILYLDRESAKKLNENYV